ncbi:molybdate ABC transporter substrate-binding protein [Campylobacter sp. RM12642]|uniref:molybdate ABC transporter substrate-binding protein n=1 Tax=unclassified Campylobacter TaxID=2593542 RepID=UPI001D40A257|nr:molybdate ABC transporter substrate-binding protein [Campylobacter sp. RM12642]MBZ8007764.1 molybdate ABC transporter substrate-binding protein [Campylobacter sp. RM9334]
MKKALLFLSLSSFALANTLNIAAAANISYPLNELKQKFEKLHPDIKLNVNTGASGSFNAQIKNGANYDVFLSANMEFAKDLEELTKNQAITYATGKLILFSAKKKPNLDDLKTASCIAIANPNTAPYGKAAKEVLNQIPNSSNIITATNISATLLQATKACDYAFVAASSVEQIKELGFSDENILKIDDKLYEPILQGMIITSKEKNAKVFYDFILSPDAKEIFNKYGYE